MKKSLLAAAVVLASCAAPSPPAATPGAPLSSGAGAKASAPGPDDEAIDDAGRAYVDMLVDTFPESATRLGLHQHDTELNEYEPARFDAATKREEQMLATLRTRLASPRASLARRVDLEILEHQLSVDVRTTHDEKPLERVPQTYLRPLDTIFQMVSRPYAPAEERARSVVARLEKVPAAVAAARTNLKNPPRIWVQIAAESARQAGPFLDEVQHFLKASVKKDDPRVDRALAGARAAYADYATFLEKDLLPRATGDFAAGRERFDFLLHEGYFLDENADAIEALGKRVLEKTEQQMTEVAKKIDPKASGWPEVLMRLKDKHPTADDLIPSYRRELARARAFLVAKDAVPFPPDDDCAVLETPAFDRNTITAAYDAAPPFDTSSTRGFFFVTPVDASLDAQQQAELLRENNHGDQVDTVVHETYPGHHLQLSFARRHPSIIRRAISTNLFDEGWALYSEELMSELGYYTDEERLMQLQWTLVRAARILIDVGLHTKGMTFDEATGILTNRVHLEKVLAVNEVKRYTGSPTQPLSYLVGREKFFALRERMKQRDGAHFSLKKFHEDVLSHAGIPLKLVAEEMFAN